MTTPADQTPGSKSGEALDARVAVEVMGWRQHSDMKDCWTGDDMPKLGQMRFVPYKQKHYFCPSTDIAAAWEVVEKMRCEGRHVAVSVVGAENPTWICLIGYPGDTDPRSARRTVAESPTAPLAICLAALATTKGDANGT